MFYLYQNYVFFFFFFFFCIQTVGFPTRKDGFIFLLLKYKVKTTNIVTFSFINPFEKINHDVFSTFQRWANEGSTLPHKLKSWGKHASKYIHWAKFGAMLAHKTYFSLQFIKFVCIGPTFVQCCTSDANGKPTVRPYFNHTSTLG